MALPAEQGLVVALEILDERFGDERVYMNQSRERLSEVDVPHTHTHTANTPQYSFSIVTHSSLNSHTRQLNPRVNLTHTR